MFQMKIAAIWKSVSARRAGRSCQRHAVPANTSESTIGALCRAVDSRRVQFLPAWLGRRRWTIAPGFPESALFSLLGTTYGGDGRTTFALPDMRGRAAIHVGTGPGLTPKSLGQKAGAETHTLSINEMPSHNHRIQATSTVADRPGPHLKILGRNNTTDNFYRGAPNQLMAPGMVTSTGGGQSFPIRDPYLTMNWCIALTGIFPSRS
jgi:microcystin-dependent protein